MRPDSKHRPAIGWALGLGLLLLGATSAHAIPVVVFTDYAFESDASFTVSTEAFFDTGPITGTGTEQVQIEEFNMVFSHRGFVQSANIVLVSPPFPEKTLVAQFIDGALERFFSVDAGGNASIPVSPPGNIFGENILLGKNLLVDIPCCSGFSRYRLTSRTGPVPLESVPEPSSALLFGISAAALFLRRRRGA